ncbi:MAG: hypothetical protein HKN41_12080 [Ilumatobacter sp.]|nr:hypothetical protein [Ilumatobacter sp.]
MRLASNPERIHGAGGEVIAISSDEEIRQAGMFERWPTPNVLYVGDPDRSQYITPLGLADPDDHREIAKPAMIVLDPDGNAVYQYVGRDFADRTTDDEVYAALEGLGLDAIEPPAGGPVAAVPDDLRGYFPPRQLAPYFRGNRMAAVAIAGRTGPDDSAFRAIAREHRQMAEATLEAWESLRSE